MPGLPDELVPGVATVIEDSVVGLEDFFGEPVLPDELPKHANGRIVERRAGGLVAEFPEPYLAIKLRYHLVKELVCGSRNEYGPGV